MSQCFAAAAVAVWERVVRRYLVFLCCVIVSLLTSRHVREWVVRGWIGGPIALTSCLFVCMEAQFRSCSKYITLPQFLSQSTPISVLRNMFSYCMHKILSSVLQSVTGRCPCGKQILDLDIFHKNKKPWEIGWPEGGRE